MRSLLDIGERISLKFLAVLFFPIVLGGFYSNTSNADTVIFTDDFESGSASSWQLEPGWGVSNDAGNFVLVGSGHAFARTGNLLWTNFTFETRIKLTDAQSSAHINYRDSCERYFLGFDINGVALSKTQPCGVHTPLQSLGDPHLPEQWYTVKIVGNNGDIEVFVDGVSKLAYSDTSPVSSGAISFESLGPTQVYFDDVLVSMTDALPTRQWNLTGGPLGGLGYDIRIDPGDKSVMYVTDNFAGVAKSVDGGRHWYQTNQGITIKGGATHDTVTIFSLTIDPNNSNIVWAGTFGDGTTFGTFKSIDGGENWAIKNNGISLGGSIGLVFRGFTIQPGNSNVVYAQAEVRTGINGKEFERVGGRVYKTTDGGDSWNQIWEGQSLSRYLIIHPNDPDILYLSTGIFDREALNSDCGQGIAGGLGVLKSLDGGQSWLPINSGLQDLYVGCLRMHPTNPQILFAAAGNNACTPLVGGKFAGGLFRTVDGGTAWTKVIGDDIMTTVNFSTSNPGVVYAGSAWAFYRSDDGGATWSTYAKPGGAGYGPPGIKAGVPIDVVVDPDIPTTLFVNNYGGGVFRSVDGAQTWENWSRGYTGAEIHDIFISSDLPTGVFAIGRSGPFMSADYGGVWTGVANGEAVFTEWYAAAGQPGNSNLILIADEHQGTILRSNSGGNHFELVFRHPDTNPADPNRRQGFKALAFSVSAPDIVYAGLAKDRLSLLSSNPVGTVIYKSVDGGETFSPQPSMLDGKNINQLVVSPVNSDILYAATSGGVHVSTSGALSWTWFNALGNRPIDALDVDFQQPPYLIAGEVFGGIWISPDDGATWSGPHNTGLSSANPHITSIEFDPTDRANVFAGDLYSGIYQSNDKGLTWSPFPNWLISGMDIRTVKDIAVNDRIIYAATRGGGVFRYWRANLVPEPFSADFGRIDVGLSDLQLFTLTNSGTQDIFINDVAYAGATAAEFGLQDNGCSGQVLLPSESCSFRAAFSPVSAGRKSALITIESNSLDLSSFDIPLSGDAISNQVAAGNQQNTGGGGGGGGGCMISAISADGPSTE